MAQAGYHVFAESGEIQDYLLGLVEKWNLRSHMRLGTEIVDELYAADCVYTCQYAGVMEVVAEGIDEIKATHYGRDMLVGWEGWTFPYMGVYTGTENNLITHWMNRGPGRRADG